MSSRFHAVIYFEDDHWHVRDTSSRNGTAVNGQKTDHAMLIDQSVITIGSTDMWLIDDRSDDDDSQQIATMVGDVAALASRRRVSDIDPVQLLAESGYVLDLYQLSLAMLSGMGKDEVVQTVLDLLVDRTSAQVATLFYDAGDGRLKPLSSSPKSAEATCRVTRKMVSRMHRDVQAIWLGRNDDEPLRKEITKSEGDAPSDLIACPLQVADSPIGLLQVLRLSGKFESSHFDLVDAASRLLAIGLQRDQEHESLVTQSKHLADRNAESDELIGDSPVMIKLRERIGRVGRANGSVLIRGESGSGKELVARAVHRGSPRAGRPMLTVNCAAIPHDLIESQLFGHKKGAFTGADNDHVGWFQQAHTGTLFLDEIGELTLEGQAKLLRILEGHPFLPVGASDQVLVDVRVIAATNRDLAEFVRAGNFREDLFYRLSVFELLVPPLRERGKDIDRLINHFLSHFCRQHGRPHLKLSREARQRMTQYAWPGNVRQLRNVIDSAVVMADEPEILSEDLGMRDAGTSRLDTLRIDEWERRLISKALSQVAGSVPEAAKLLGISRATAYRKITEYGIDRQ